MFGVIVLVGTYTGGVSAQEPDSLPADSANFPTTFLMEGITVEASRRLTAVGGASVIELRLDSLASTSIPTLEQALREMPLVRVRVNSRGEAQPSLRGATDRQIAVLVDGVPLTLGWDHRTDLSIIPLTAARSINLIRGLSSVLHGPNVLAGVVEIDVARGNRRMEMPAPATFSMGLDQTGSFVVGATGARLFEPARGQWLVQAGGGFRDRSGTALPESSSMDPLKKAFLSADGKLRLNSDVRHVDGFMSTRFQGDGGSWGSLTASAFDVERGVPPETHESTPRLWRYPDQRRMIAAFSSGTGQRTTAWGRGDLEASVGIDRSSFMIHQFETLQYRNVVGQEEGQSQTITMRVLGEHTLSHRADLRGAFTYGDVSHTERLGNVVIEQQDYRQRLWSLGSEAEWRFDDLVGWEGLGASQMTFGVVVDGADTPETGDKPTLGRLSDWGVRLGLSSLTAGSSMLFHGGVSRRARFPSLRELYSEALGRFLPNPDLGPEILTGGELGLTWHLTALNLQMVAFHQVLSEAIVRVSVATPDGNKRQRVNRDRIRSTGLELVASGTWERIQYTGDLTFQETWQLDQDSELRSRPEYEPRISSRLSLSTPLYLGSTISSEYRFVGSQFCLNADSGAFDRLDGTGSLDFQLRRRFTRPGRDRFANVDALVSVANVTNGAIFDQCGLPQSGRTVRVQVRLF